MKIKHFVITRFLSTKHLGLGDKIFDEDIIQNGIDYVNNFFIPSMNNQTNKDFEIIFIINNEHDIENSGIKKLRDINTDILCHILKDNEYFNFCKEQAKGYDWLILTRMDYDDLVKNTAAEEIQSMVKKNSNYDLFCYGYNTGYTLNLKNKNLYNFEKSSYYKSGYFSIFESLCMNLKTVKNPINVYSCQHTHLKKEVEKKGKAEYLRYMIPPDSTCTNNFVWVRHENTGTELISGTAAFNNRFRNQCEIPNNFKELFGTDI